MPCQSSILILGLVCGCLLTAGCGAGAAGKVERAAIEGQVLLDGRPVEEGRINFLPTGETKGPLSGAVIASGGYSIPAEMGPAVGTNRVEVHAMRKTGRMLPAIPPSPEIEEMEEVVPARYNAQSELVIEVRRGVVNELNIELETDP